jgi:ADP-ribose pyrophosphatase
MPMNFTGNDVEVEKPTTAYQGFFKINQYTFKHKLYEGGWSKTISRELFERGNAAAVLMYDSAEDAVVMIEQFRIGALSETSPWLLEIVAGMVEEGEVPSEVVIREAKEEANCTLTEVEHITDYLSSPGGTNEKITLYFANVDSRTCEGVYGLESEGEDILVRVLPFDDAWAMVETGQCNNAMTLIALQWLKIKKLTNQV